MKHYMRSGPQASLDKQQGLEMKHCLNEAGLFHGDEGLPEHTCQCSSTSQEESSGPRNVRWVSNRKRKTIYTLDRL